MTMVPVTVIDPIGQNVLGLDRDNFRVEARPIVSFGTDDAPVSVGLIFDCSSMKDEFDIVRKVPAEFYKQLNPMTTVSASPSTTARNCLYPPPLPSKTFRTRSCSSPPEAVLL